jgi:hypothetical protein
MLKMVSKMHVDHKKKQNEEEEQQNGNGGQYRFKKVLSHAKT